MKRMVFVCVIALVMTIVVGGCHEKEPPAAKSTVEAASAGTGAPASPEPVATESAKPALPTSYAEAETTLGKIHIGAATEENIGQYSSVLKYVQDEDGASIIIRTDEPLKDFAFITVNFKEVGNALIYSVGKILFSAQELTPEKPFVVKMLFIGDVAPSYGISYTDNNGAKKYYTLNLDGRGIEEAPPYFLLEFKNGK